MRVKKTIILLAALTLVGCSDQGQQQKTISPRPIISAVVGISRSTGGYPGVVEARVSSDLGFRVLGNVNSRPVEVGDFVTRGQVLATLESSSQSLKVSAAEADLRNAEARMANAQVTRDRQRTLADGGLGITAIFEQAEQALKSAQANVGKAEAILAKAREQLLYTTLRAQFDGIVTRTSTEVGQTADAGEPVVTVAQPDEREVVIDVPDEVYRGLRIGTPFVLRLQLDNQQAVRGVVRELAPSADPLTRTRRVRITLLSPGKGFRIGAVATAYLAPSDTTPVTVPRRAVGTGDGVFVWIVDEDRRTVTKRVIEVDEDSLSTDEVTVLKGLDDGERVVLAGVNSLAEGQAIRFSKRSEP
ncbi:efflux RND transporter periplasmic adaptor subunit [Agrobacterium sp. BA1120]|uniref:efflux RND transporter periplasmic adaptor subunit n=1 Tax=Agrobacterium sp. BA1120 TaxID=3228927 RepID=UPI00336A401E